MDNTDLCFLSIRELSSLISRRKVSPVDLLHAYLDRIERLDDALGAYATVLSEEARRSAVAAEREIAAGNYKGCLHGIPVSLKDLYDVAGVRTTAGSLVFADRVATVDSAVTTRLIEAGAVIIGKANLFEFAIGPRTPYHYGETRNPWGLDRYTGSSSSGSGVAVSAGLCVASMGTDSAGSIRLPAAFCGVVGLKPTYGRVSRFGIIPLAWSLDAAGPLTRTAADAAILLQAVAGHDPRDPASAREPVPNYTESLVGGLQGVRVGVPTNFFFDSLDPDVEGAVRDAVRVLQTLGALLRDVPVPDGTTAGTASSVIMLAEGAAFHEKWLRTQAEKYGKTARSRLEMGSTILAGDYIKAQRVRTLLVQEFQHAMEQVDVLVMPTTGRPAPRITDALPRNDSREAAKTANNRFTRVFNLLGWPAISLPCGFSRDGLPIGLQIVGAPFAEGVVLRVAHAYEQATDWHGRRPPMAVEG